MSELSLARLVEMMKEELAACGAGQSEGYPQLRAETLELEVALAVVPGEDGQAKVALAETGSNPSGTELHRARIGFKVNPGLGWTQLAGPEAGSYGESSGLPPSREALLPDAMQAAPGSSADPDFEQQDFDRMMDEIEGVSKKKKKRKKS